MQNFNYGYNNYGYSQPNYQYQQPQQTQYQQQNQQQMFSALVINNFNDVERYIVAPNQTVNFYDGKNGYFFTKSADGMGRYTIKAFKLNEIDLNELLNPQAQTENKPSFLTKNDLIGYATQEDFKRLEKEFKDTLEHMAQQFGNVKKESA